MSHIINNLYLLDKNDNMMLIQNFWDSKKYIIIIMFAFIILSILVVSLKPKKKKEKNFVKPHNDSVLINQNNIDSKEIIQKIAFDKLIELKKAKMNYDLNTIKKITTNNIYDLYNVQINTLKTKKQKNIIQNTKYINSYITNLTTNGNIQVINLRIIIENYDFIVDNHNKTVSGLYNQKVMQTYELELKRDINSDNCIIQKIQLLYERAI